MTKNLLEFRFRSFEVASRNRGYVCLFFFHLLDQISFPICLEWAPNCQRFSFVAWDCFLCWDINVKRKNKKKLILTEVRGLKGKEIDPIHGPFYFWLAGPVGKRNPLAAAGLTQSVKRLTTEREVDSRDRTNTQGLKITEKWRYSLCTTSGWTFERLQWPRKMAVPIRTFVLNT